MVEIYPIAKLVIDEIFTNLLLCYISQILNTVYCLMTITKIFKFKQKSYKTRKTKEKPKKRWGV
jgi:hypothetical protein